MGYLLKEALKALCAVNQWSYAVFWKIGCQNPKLLIWEEFYNGSLPKQEENKGSQVGDPVQLLMDKMMMSNQVCMVGEGLVGRAAFTGNHQWIVYGNYQEIAHPMVLNEVHLQFSAGIQTIVIIPVVPHGVVQFGSALPIMENAGFVHEVKSLILQAESVPSVLMPDNYVIKNATSSIYEHQSIDVTSVPYDLHGNRMQTNLFPVGPDSFNMPNNSCQTPSRASDSSNSLLSQFQHNLQVCGTNFTTPNFMHDSCKSSGNYEPANISSIVDDSQINQSTCTNDLVSRASGHQSDGECQVANTSTNISLAHLDNNGHLANMKIHNGKLRNSELTTNTNIQHGKFLQKSPHANVVFHDTNSSDKVLMGMFNTGQQFTTRHGSAKAQHKLQEHISGSFIPNDFCDGNQVPSSVNPMPEDGLFQSPAGDDLFDVLGVDFKNKLLSGNNSQLLDGFGTDTKDQVANFVRSGVCSDYYEGISESGVFSSSGSDHLLDAVISGVGSAVSQISDHTSGRTNLSKISSSLVPSTPHSNSPLSGLVNLSDQMQGHQLWPSKPMARSGEPISTSRRSACSKNDAGSCSLTSSTYGSQISSWIEQGPSVSVSTANSKKPDESGKTNRKRLKPGENPRPRPKDRQMIQDRVKELREIVPNGAKCSIDALLERTIKHMLFLQSVAKHADKLKQTVKSKLTSKEGGMLLKENSDGGATWAFELGSKSMVCPIVVEDLNPPRQFLIEMLCEDRGFFLEIADIIRGMELTILKGIMEARNAKIWAHFAVEANRDVTRMEVFISLIHLVEQTLNGGVTSTNGPTDENL